MTSIGFIHYVTFNFSNQIINLVPFGKFKVDLCSNFAMGIAAVMLLIYELIKTKSTGARSSNKLTFFMQIQEQLTCQL